MAAIPRIEVEVLEDLPDGTSVSHGRVDFMPTFAEIARRGPVSLEMKTRLPMGHLTISDLDVSLPDSMREAAYEDRLATPDILRAFHEVHARIGHEGFLAAGAALQGVDLAERRLRHARLELERLQAGQWSSDVGDLVMAQSDDLEAGNEGYVNREDLEDRMVSAFYEAYAKDHPRPRIDFDSPEYAAWNSAFSAWARLNATPYAYATKALYWEGVSLETLKGHRSDMITEEQESQEALGHPISFDPGDMVTGIIESEMESQHEDAEERVVAEDDLWSMVEEWGRTGDDAALAGKLEAWNARQTIVSYMVDHGTIIPVFPDATLQESLDYARRRIAAAEIAVEEARNTWIQPSREEDAPVGPGMRR